MYLSYFPNQKLQDLSFDTEGSNLYLTDYEDSDPNSDPTCACGSWQR